MAKKGRYVYEWPRPMVTVDAAVFAFFDDGAKLLLVQRKYAPYEGHWALPGGFIEMDEELAAAAARELVEETGLRGITLEPLGVFGAPGRDPRGRVITVVFTGIAARDRETIRAADDAARVEWFDIENLPSMAFDHDEIARCAIRRIKHTKAYRAHAKR